HRRIALHGRDVTHVAARKRGVGLVFQNYALIRHMTVAENIEFALRVRHVRARERRRRPQELLRLVALEGLDQRLPAQLSGGRLLEMGAPHDLYSRPATRFVATFLGAANLLLARRTPDGIQMGVSTVAAAERSPDLGEHEVVAVVRPEEVELAASRDALKSGYLARAW